MALGGLFVALARGGLCRSPATPHCGVRRDPVRAGFSYVAVSPFVVCGLEQLS